MLLTVALLFSFAVQGLSQQQCFTERGCVGNVTDTPGPTATDCCVGTDNGMSFGIDSNNCEYRICHVHGFKQISYTTLESQTLTGIDFVPLVKGTRNSFTIDGMIIALDDTGSTDDDIDDFQTRMLDNSYSAVGMQIIPREDTLSLEDGDRIKLQFIPDNAQEFEDFFEQTRQFIRHTTYVNIIDDDGLTINFGSLDYDVGEEGGSITIVMTVRETQKPFTLILTPTTIDDALAVSGNSGFNVADFVPEAYINSRPEARATPGQDYNATQIVLIVNASEVERTVKQPIIIYEDDIDEIEQRFIIIGELGPDVPDNTVCFRVNQGDSGCIGNGRKGATGVGINDNDLMIIGFTRRETNVNETVRLGVNDVRVEIKSMITSEIDYDLGVRVLGPTQQTSSDQAIVEASGKVPVFRSDATFGNREEEDDPRSNLIEMHKLNRHQTDVASITVAIVSDFIPEETECFDLSIYPINNEFMTENFKHNDTASFFEKHTICILDDDDPFRVAFDQTIYYVIESELAVTVCVNLTFPSFDILEEVVEVRVYNDPNSMYLPPDPNLATADSPDQFNGSYPMAPRTDYKEEIQKFSTIKDTDITRERRMICYEQVIYDDLRLEMEEYAGLTLVADDSDTVVETEPLYDDSVFIIIDDDSARVGLEQIFYNVAENIGFVDLCAVVYEPVIDCPIEFPFAVQLSTIDNTAVDPMDYGSLNMTLMFDTCDPKQCVTVTIVDDFEDELDEDFFYTLTRPPGGLDSRITLNPTLGEVLIRDNDVPIRVGYDPIVYETSESEGMVVLNVRIFDPPSGGAPRPFTLSVSTQEGTAVSPEDYVGVNGEIIQFNTGDTAKTHTIFIEQDQICETDPIEVFFSNIVLDDGVQPIEVIRSQATIFINDTLEPECEIVVGYEKIVYVTPEGMSYVELCAVVTSHDGAPRPFIISATTQDGTAVSGDDYVAVVDEILMFAEGVDRVCHNVTILQDDDCEILRVEDFFSDLSYVSGDLPITIAPDVARVIIDDSNEPECQPIEVGYDPVVYYTSEGQGFVELNIRIIDKPPSGMAPRPFTLSISTKDDTAVSNNDYNAVNGEIIQFNTGDTNKQHRITINDDPFCEVPDEQFFSDITLVSGIPMIDVTVPRAVVIITNDSIPDCVVTTVMVNDTLTGDPLMTVPISIENDVITSLCYEVHGEADKFFNLISDTCVSVNSHYAKAAIDNENITLNIVDSIGVLAYDQGICVNIGVSLKNCQASVNGANVSRRYNNNGISVRSFNNRVRISVPNCAPTDLVMWVFCTSGRTEDPYTWKYYEFDFIRFVVMRGLNLDPTSHGLIGQFWNVDVEVEEYTGMFNGEDEDTDYVITVKTPSEKKFVGIKASVTWEFEERPCLYVGNSQAGPLGETVDPGVNDAVIEGTYKDYVVSSMFSPSFTYVRFNMNCPV